MWWIHFLFSAVFFSGDNCIWSPCFFFITEWFSVDTFGETTFWITSVTRLFWDYFNIDQQKVHFLRRHVLQWQSLTYFHMVYQSIFSFGHLFFFLRLFYFSTWFFSLGFSLFLSSSNLFPSFWPVLVLFWILWVLVVAIKLKHMAFHVRHSSRITT